MSGELRTNKQGRDLIRTYENVGLSARQDTHGCWRIGYGHTERVSEGLTISQAQADSLFRLDLERVEGGVRRSLRGPVNRNEFSALVSFAYDVGMGAFEASPVVKYINAGDRKATVDALIRMTPGDPAQEHKIGSPSAKRRAAEASLFMTVPPLDAIDAPVADRLERAARKLAHPGPHRTPKPLLNAARVGVLPWLGIGVLFSGLAVVREVAEIADIGNLDHALLNGLIDALVLWPRAAHLAMAFIVFLAVCWTSFVVLRHLKD
ncbi:MAG: lysozyme [Alphaproteobacteria bacterium]